MPRTPSSTPPRSPGTPISDRSLSPPPLNNQHPVISSPSSLLQNGIAPTNVRQTPSPPLSPRRTQSPRHPPDPNLVDTSRPPPMRQPLAPQQVIHFYLQPILEKVTNILSKIMPYCERWYLLLLLSDYLLPPAAAASSPARPIPPSPFPPPTLLPPTTHQPC